MSLWLRRVRGLDTDTMREIADQANVPWSAKSIIYRANGIGYVNGEKADSEAIQDAAESILGYRPVVIDAPPQSDATD